MDTQKEVIVIDTTEQLLQIFGQYRPVQSTDYAALAALDLLHWGVPEEDPDK